MHMLRKSNAKRTHRPNESPQFRGACKVRKGKNKSRPAVSCVNSAPEILSRQVNCWLNMITHNLMPTHLRDAEHLARPPNSKLFSVDAVAMCSNIDTEHGLDVMNLWLKLHWQHMPEDAPCRFLQEALKEAMANDVF